MPGLPWGGEQAFARARHVRFLPRHGSVDPIDG